MAKASCKGDTVVLRRGKEKGKRGIVKAVFPKNGVATVEGVNVVKRHTKPGQSAGRRPDARRPAASSRRKRRFRCPR
jgi:large subunit ribosomal protein L24